MLPQENRFSFRKGYPRNILQTPLFALRYQKNDSILHCAVVVGKKVDPKATGRNKIKRQFTSLLEKTLVEKTPVDFVFILKPEILNADSDTISKHLRDTLGKIH